MTAAEIIRAAFAEWAGREFPAAPDADLEMWSLVWECSAWTTLSLMAGRRELAGAVL
jgi:hypothetical protein